MNLRTTDPVMTSTIPAAHTSHLSFESAQNGYVHSQHWLLLHLSTSPESYHEHGCLKSGAVSSSAGLNRSAKTPTSKTEILAYFKKCLFFYRYVHLDWCASHCIFFIPKSSQIILLACTTWNHTPTSTSSSPKPLPVHISHPYT